MVDDETVTPGEAGQGMTPERKRAELEATGSRDTAAIEHNERTREHAGNVILRSARTFKRALGWRGKVL
jgi:hypothetical protein